MYGSYEKPRDIWHKNRVDWCTSDDWDLSGVPWRQPHRRSGL